MKVQVIASWFGTGLYDFCERPIIEFDAKSHYTQGLMSISLMDWQSKRSQAKVEVRVSKQGSERLSGAGDFLRLAGRAFFKWTFLGLFAFLGLSVFMTALYGFVPVPFTPLMVMRAGESLVAGRSVTFEKDWVELNQISRRMQYAVVASEDWKFFDHNGFDWEAIAKALEHNERGKRIRGGSTISQQVAKNVFLLPQRSWIRKSVEAYFTVLIETMWSKERIMEVYLNVIELGDGVYGVEAASRKFFKKSAASLSASEAALISAVLPNPRRFRIDRPSSYVRFRQTLIQRRMRSVPAMISRT